MYEDPKSKISQLEKVLNARENRIPIKAKRHELHNRETGVSQNWDNSEFDVGGEVSQPDRSSDFEPAEMKKGATFPIKILIGSVVFFVIALGVVFYEFLGGNNIVSGNNIVVTVKAPISVASGETWPFEIDIKNNNSITLSGVDMGVAYPSGATEISNTSLPAKRVQSFLGDILPGQNVKKNLSVILFGTENEKKEINITLEYKVAGSNSLFNKTKTVTVLVSSAPVSIVVTNPIQVNTNQEVNFSVDVTSNSLSVIKNLLLKVDYPFGFTFVGSSPKTFSGNNLWLIGDLNPGVKRTITFSGTLSGQEGEERGFNFSTGSQSPADSSVIGATFATSFSSVTINRPFVSADVTLNGDNSPTFISLAGSKIEAVVNWQNNLPNEVSDVSIVVKLSGNSIDKSSVQADGGFYQSVNNTITFNKTTDDTFASLTPGQVGTSKFTFSSFGANSITGSGLSNPIINLDVSVSGQQVGNQTNVLFSDSRKIKISANPRLLAKVLHYVGPFQNSGPVPPKSEQETTYTVTWTVTNPINNLSSAQVKATLPPYVKWLGAVSPDSEKMNYDAGTGVITWNVGNVTAGAGTVSAAHEVSFQISFLPSVDQIGTAPDLVGEAILSAKDNFTLTAVSASFPAVNTRLNNDPYFRADAETVVE